VLVVDRARELSVVVVSVMFVSVIVEDPPAV
jgi:hypothetical protein